MKSSGILWLPFVLVIALFAVFWLGLENPSDRVIASQIVGQKLPEFAAQGVEAGFEPVSSRDFADGKPRLLNVFASWCVPCRAEIPVLLRLKRQGIEIVGLAVHDRPEDVEAFLAAYGNPYSRIGLDQQGRAQIAFGSSGVPETFVIDGKGRVLHQQIGVVRASQIPQILRLLGESQ